MAAEKGLDDNVETLIKLGANLTSRRSLPKRAGCKKGMQKV